MPELPEVEIARRALEREVAGHAIVEVRIPDPEVVRRRLSTRPSDAATGGASWLEGALPGRRTRALIRHGKRIGWSFGDLALILHLGMTGRWLRAPTDPAPRFGRLGLVLPAGDALWFVDARRFGCVVPATAEHLREQVRGDMGPDALDEPLDPAALRARLTGRRPIKVALMDQRVLAGLGNIQAAEALWRACVDPATPCRALDDAAIERLSRAIPAQLQETIARDGEGDLVYVSEGGDNPFAVYGHEGAPCPRCGAPIVRTVLGGRATFSCPRCQPR